MNDEIKTPEPQLTKPGYECDICHMICGTPQWLVRHKQTQHGQASKRQRQNHEYYLAVKARKNGAVEVPLEQALDKKPRKPYTRKPVAMQTAAPRILHFCPKCGTDIEVLEQAFSIIQNGAGK